MMKESFLARGNAEKGLQMNGQMMAADIMMLAATAAAGKNRMLSWEEKGMKAEILRRVSHEHCRATCAFMFLRVGMCM